MGQLVKKRSATSAFGVVARRGHDARPFYAKRLYTQLSTQEEGSGLKTDVPKSTLPTARSAQTQERVMQSLYCQDSRAMTQLADESVDLMITSPPYNVGKEYDADLSLAEYEQLLSAVFKETYRVLAIGGRACINIANVGRKPYIPLHALVVEVMGALGYLMRGEIIWDKGASAGSSCAWGSWRSAKNPVLRDVHEYILVFSKGEFGKSNGGESTIGRDAFLTNTKSIWQFPAASARRLRHPAPFPLELPRRLIELYSYKGDLVLDPFVGSGTTCLAAAQLGRSYVGYDNNASYIAFARERISAWQAQRSQPPRQGPLFQRLKMSCYDAFAPGTSAEK